MSKFSIKQKRIAVWLLVLGCMALIFCFSSQNIDESGEISGKVTQEIVSGTKKVVKDEQLQNQIIWNVQKYMRKYAHAIIYALLGAVLTGVLQFYPLKVKYRVGLAVGISFLFGCTDEIHQLFVDGRGARFTDVCIDTLGALVGALLAVLVNLWYRKIKQKRAVTRNTFQA